MDYKFLIDRQTETPQTECIPGRESEMVKGRSGTAAFDVGTWKTLRRCLLIGTASGSFYASKQELSSEFIDVLNKAIDEDPRKVADEILYASGGRSINNSAPILALVLLSKSPKPEAKTAFREIFKQVVRTGSHFHEWMAYTKAFRGMGRLIRDAAIDWLSSDPKWLCYQMLKYPQRKDFCFADELRLFKPKKEGDLDTLYSWIVGKPKIAFDFESTPESLKQIAWYEWLKTNPDKGEEAVRSGGLTHEMVAPIANMNKDVWQALFESMPVTALLRNLASLTEIGVIRFDTIQNLDRVESVLNDRDVLRKARIHPIDVLKALKTYQSGGRLGRSSKTWHVVDRIVSILNKAVELSFEIQEPTNKVFLHAIDVSGSMSWSPLETVNLKCCEIAAVMALVTAKAEKNYIIRGFSTDFKDLGISSADSFDSACNKTINQNFGGTDASVAYDWAIEHKVFVDCFVFWTDSESWAGYRHPSQALKVYRQRINPNAKAVYVTLQSNKLSLVDPEDPLSYDLGGFDPSTPKIIQMIAQDEI